MKPLMTPEHPQWSKFCNTLAGPRYCNFRGRTAKTFKWRCKDGSKRPYAREILKNMGCNITGSLRYFDEHGGHCDCEILFNVDRGDDSLNTNIGPE